MDAGELVPGDLILLRQGAAVPADCIVQSRSLHVDQSVITGESHPVAIPEGEQARMGSTVTRGEAEATVFKTGKNTFYGKTATLLQATGNELGELRKMLFFVVLVLLAFSGVLCVICLAFLLGNHMNLQSSIEFVCAPCLLDPTSGDTRQVRCRADGRVDPGGDGGRRHCDIGVGQSAAVLP